MGSNNCCSQHPEKVLGPKGYKHAPGNLDDREEEQVTADQSSPKLAAAAEVILQEPDPALDGLELENLHVEPKPRREVSVYTIGKNGGLDDRPNYERP
mmetsp:Transcript_84527/g.217739  ORF Transcript_84527/g.217739 Transcript_84527/m.217739 type:complete len:98 (-) Transcript_84527:285-578(-)